MDLTHDFVVPLDVPTAWEAFNDLERIAPCFPGAAITSVDGDDFTGTARVKLGPVSLQYSGTGTFVERDEAARRAVITASGKDKRGNGTASATITAHLEAVPDGTKVVVETDLKITGRPAQFGRGVIADVGSKILDQFAQCLAANLGRPAEPGPGEAAVPGTAPGTASGGASREAAAGGEASGEAGHVEAGQAAGTTAGPGAAAVPGAGNGDRAGSAVGPSATGTPGAAVPAAAASGAAASGAAASGGAARAAASGRPATPPPRPLAPTGAAAELDLGAVVLPTLLRRYGPTALACAVTALLTWWVARR